MHLNRAVDLRSDSQRALEEMGSPAMRRFRRGRTRSRWWHYSGGLQQRGRGGRHATEDGELEFVVGGGDGFPRWCRRVTGGWRGRRRFGTSSTTRSCRGKAFVRRSEEAPEGGEERKAREGVRGGSTTSLQMIFGGGLHELRQRISLRWWRLRFGFQREMGEESAGLKGKGLQGWMRYRRERGKWGKWPAVSGEREGRWRGKSRRVGPAW
jgi:hypothetical protein